MALDAKLNKKYTLVLIGGAAATLYYNSKEGTLDLDSWRSVQEIEKEYQAVVMENPELKIPLTYTTVAIGPRDSNKRLLKYEAASLKNLTIKVPEIHDWVILKTARGDEKDVDDILAMNEEHKIDPKTLLQRVRTEVFEDELGTGYPGNARFFVESYLNIIDQLFGDYEYESQLITLRKILE